MKRFSRNTIIFSVFLLAALAWRVIYLRQFSASPLFAVTIGPDVEEYDKWAREMLAWGFNSGSPHIHAPLYPALLALLYYVFSFKMFLIRFFQTVLVLAGFVLLARTVKNSVAPKQPAVMWIFLLLAAFYPLLLFYSSELISESLLLPLLCLTLALLYRAENQLSSGRIKYGLTLAGAAGICSGLATLTHPTCLLFIALETVLLAVSALFRKNTGLKLKILPPLLFITASLLVIAPVCVKNSRKAGQFVLIQQNSGFNLYLGNNPNATGTCYIRPGKEWTNIHKWGEAGGMQRGISKDKFFTYMTLKFIWSNPAEEFKLLVKKAFYAWNFRELTAGADMAPLMYFTGIVRSGKYLFILLGSLSICGIFLVLLRRESIFRYRHFLLLTLAYWAAQTITVTSGRYRLAMYPAFFIFAAFALNYLLEHGKERKSLLKFAAGFLIAILTVSIPSPPVNLKKEQAEADSIYGEAYFKQEKYKKAAKHLYACLNFDPINYRAYDLLGIISEADSPAKAAQYYRLAIKSTPDEPEGYLNLAIQYSNRGDYKQAENYFAQALRYGPENVAVLYNYGCFLQKKGDLEAAAKYLKRCLREAPWHDKAMNTLGVICIQNKKPEAALKYLTAAHKLAPEKTGVMLNLAVALRLNGKAQEAINMLRKAAALEPDNKSAKFLLEKWRAGNRP
ncbi:MAG: tetratricopeptide repeat protein [Victivallaceae bacterium]|nr:tetratricopeptide repeat protein [Victivallaceae bacterium]